MKSLGRIGGHIRTIAKNPKQYISVEKAICVEEKELYDSGELMRDENGKPIVKKANWYIRLIDTYGFLQTSLENCVKNLPRYTAIFREAKERKAKEREEAARQAQLKEEQKTNQNFFNASCAIIPIIGIALGGYYFLYLRNPTKENTREEDRKDREDQESKRKKPNLEKL